MKFSNWFKVALASLALFGSASGCSDSGTTNTVRATSRTIRGKVPTTIRGVRVTQVMAINAATRRVQATTTVGADGTFVLNNVTVGATYRLHLRAGNRSIPVVFPKTAGAPAKTNLFKVGTKTSPRAGRLEGDINIGDASNAVTTEMGEDELSLTGNNAPNAQEDFDEDGMPDNVDMDVDGDNVPNDMDMDNDGDGMPDNTAFGDQDGDGITNESDPDVDGDGMPNAMDMDNDNDGMPDAMDTSPNGDNGNPSDDTDGDGIPNTEDTSNPDDGVGGGEGGDGGVATDAGMGGGIPAACTSCASMNCSMQLGACINDPVCAACLSNPTPACRENPTVTAALGCACMSCAEQCGSICASGM